MHESFFERVVGVSREVIVGVKAVCYTCGWDSGEILHSVIGENGEPVRRTRVAIRGIAAGAAKQHKEKTVGDGYPVGHLAPVMVVRGRTTKTTE